MTGLFWLLLIPAVLTFGLIAWATYRVCCAIERAYQRRQVQKELQAMLRHEADLLDDIMADLRHLHDTRLNRGQLDALATAQDKATRRIVH